MTLPGNPSPAQTAEADQKLAACSAAVDKLLAGPAPTGTEPILVVVDLVTRIATAAARLDVEGGGTADDIEAPILAIAAELLRRALTTNQGAPTA